MRLNCDYTDLDYLLEQYQKKVPDCEKLTRNEVKRFEAIYYRLAVISNGGWVSVKDRLPKENTAVNVVWVNRNPASYYAHIKDKPFTATAVYYDDSWYWWYDTIEDIISEYGGRAPIAGMIDLDIEITHWQSLPEPPKEGDSE